MTRFVALAIAVALILAWAPAGRTCPFCSGASTTFMQEAGSASLILFGTPKNARIDAAGQGTTDFDIELVIKSHEFVGGKKSLVVPRYMPQTDPEKPYKFLLFGDVYKGQLDIYRGVPFKADSRIGEYLKGAIALKDKDWPSRLKFFFKYLDDSDVEVSNDAYSEFAAADYKDVRAASADFSADKLRRWLKDPATPASRYGLYGMLLGHCGNAEDADFLRSLVLEAKKRFSSGLDGVFTGQLMLQPKEGWEFLGKALADSKSDFLVRYAALRAARFIWEYRPDLVDRVELANKVAVMLDQADVADLAIEDLRRWQSWSAAGRVADMIGKPGFDSLLMRRSILRYALRCPAKDSPKLAAFVAEQKKKDAKWVEEVESLLNTESAPAVGGAATAK